MRPDTFVKMENELKKQGISWDVPPCCDPKAGNYSLLRVQIRGEILVSPQGVWIEGTEHNEKCYALLKLAKEKNYSLVLFPEYCISDNLLRRLVRLFQKENPRSRCGIGGLRVFNAWRTEARGGRL